MSRGLGLEFCSRRLSQRLGQPPLLLACEGLLALSLCVYLFFLLLPEVEAPRHYDGNTMNRFLFTTFSHDPTEAHKDVMRDFNNWEARLPGPVLAGWVDDQVFTLSFELYRHHWIEGNTIRFGGYHFQVRALAFGFYNAFWLGLTFLALGMARRDALLLMLGIFGGLMYNFIIPAGKWFYPWDLPAMFFFTLAFLLYDQRRFWALLAIIWLGALFKETTLCCGLLVLLGEHWGWRKRLAGVLGLGLAYWLARNLLMHAFGVDVLLLALNNGSGSAEVLDKTWAMLCDNVHHLFSLQLNHVLFVNAGSLLLLLLLPWSSRRDVLFKTVALLFIAGQFLCGIIIEFRIWYELLPLGWILVSEALARRLSPVSEAGGAAPVNDRAQRLLRGSHVLLLGGLLAAALVLLVLPRHLFTGLATGGPHAAPSSAQTAPPTFNERMKTAALLQAQGRNKETLAELREMVRVYPQEGAAFNNLAWTLASSPDSTAADRLEAVTIARRAVNLSQGHDPQYLMTLALAYEQTNQNVKARDTAERARELALFLQAGDMSAVAERFLASCPKL